MSDQWQMFLRREGEDTLFILTDVGIHDVIADEAPPTLVRIDLPIVSDDGYPDEAQDEALNVAEDHINPMLAALGSVFVGRITRPGMRSLYHYAPIGEDELEPLLGEVESRLGRRPGSYVGADPEHLVYKRTLYPTFEEWSMIHDFEVFDRLGENGDERDEPREVTHFAYFPDRTGADAFAADVEDHGYSIAEIGERPDRDAEGHWCVRFTRQDTPAFGMFTEANAALRKAAWRHGGAYDGWETMVIRKLQ
jgi:hypothetical protein